MINLKRVWVRSKARFERGYAICSYAILLFTLATYAKIWELSTKATISVSIIMMSALFLIGHYDITKIKLLQAEQQYSTGELNPVFKKMSDQLNFICEELTKP